MAEVVDLKSVVKHLVDGTFDTNLCKICLLPLPTVCENIFTRVCKEDEEYCIADVLEHLCNIKISDADNSNICSDCFLMASTAYKFYLTAKRSDEILNFYVDELEKNVYSIEIPEDYSSDTLCITLPEYIPSTKYFDYDIEACLIEEYFEDQDSVEHVEIKKEMNEFHIINTKTKNKKQKKYNDNLIVAIEEKGQQQYYTVGENGQFVLVSEKEDSKPFKQVCISPKQKVRRKRDPLDYTHCSRCPVKYRFLSKLKGHMKAAHDVDLFICKICKATTEDATEHETHLAGHTGIHRCEFCNTIFKKRETIISHMKWHEEMKNIVDMDNCHVCEICGYIVLDEEQLNDHYDKKHDKKYTCFYCGKMYKSEISCEAHIRKHELLKNQDDERDNTADASPKEAPRKKDSSSGKRRTICATCGKDFVDERSLMWHSMLHTNERPYTCDTCGRGFISVNRRNQHMLCAHTMPTKQCPLCPALFHLRSMVNSHIKKVGHHTVHCWTIQSTAGHTMPTKQCPLCPALFHLRSMVNSHIKKVGHHTVHCWTIQSTVGHTMPTKQCPLCPALFHLRSMVNSHIKKVGHHTVHCWTHDADQTVPAVSRALPPAIHGQLAHQEGGSPYSPLLDNTVHCWTHDADQTVPAVSRAVPPAIHGQLAHQEGGSPYSPLLGNTVHCWTHDADQTVPAVSRAVPPAIHGQLAHQEGGSPYSPLLDNTVHCWRIQSTAGHTMPTKQCPLCPALFHLRSMVNSHIKKVGHHTVHCWTIQSTAGHTMPTKQCPLCPALFHLRSMVNSHIKKVGHHTVHCWTLQSTAGHTMPTKQCPLCPALFHLRSMVNSHIKKVHLRTHKRRNRASKHRDARVHWRTQPVPIEELSVDIQHRTIQLQTKLHDLSSPATRDVTDIPSADLVSSVFQ
ncbi:hypothetical protein NE865_13850 [Phthorimaea operculella]|nr:hypothetical protein NE865_13850 [Phthorimaea operculella]